MCQTVAHGNLVLQTRTCQGMIEVTQLFIEDVGVLTDKLGEQVGIIVGAFQGVIRSFQDCVNWIFLVVGIEVAP